MHGEGKKTKESRVKGRGALEKGLDFLRAARDAFCSTYRALQTTRGTALCSPTRYGAHSGFLLPIWAANVSFRVSTRFPARFLPYAFCTFFSFIFSYLATFFVVRYLYFFLFFLLAPARATAATHCSAHSWTYKGGWCKKSRQSAKRRC